MNQSLVSIFQEIRDIPYEIPLEFGVEDNCCSGKHEKLKAILEERGYPARWRLVEFKWSDMDLPEKVGSVAHDDDSTHVYLEVKINNEWKTVDATWDKGISHILPVNEWDGASNTQIAVKPTKTYSPEKSQELLEKESGKEFFDRDIAVNGEFYEAFNNWLAEERR